MFDVFFFAALPYITMLLLVGGSIYRAFTGVKTSFRGKLAWSARGDLLWTTRSTGFFGRASIGPSALALHWGLILVIAAHIVGFIGGAGNWPVLVDMFRWGGMLGGMLLFYGAFWAFMRRLTIPQLRAMSTLEDHIVLIFLIVLSGLGLYHSIIQLAFGVSYAVGPWFAGIFKFQPDIGVVAGAPFFVKLHMIVALVFLAYLPFTKLVHVFSYPYAYITRPYISMRSYFGLKK